MSTFLVSLEMPRIEAALRDAKGGSPEARWVAAIALGREDGAKRREALEALQKLLFDSCEEVRAQALEGIAEQKLSGAEISENIAGRLLDDSSPCVRCAAVESAAVLLTNPIRAVVPLLKDADPSVRAAAATALGDLRAVREADLLAELLDDSDEFTARRAAMALAALDDLRCESKLVSLLAGEQAVASEAAFALGELGGATSVPALKKIARGRFSPLGLRAAAAAAMTRCSAPEGRELLVALLTAGSHIKRMTALGAIARLPVTGVAAAVGALIEARHMDQISSAIQTLAAIGEVDSKAARHELKRHLGRLGGEFEDELREALASLDGVD
jgi:HEAT repeat protein